jgi:hypothetical protein
MLRVVTFSNVLIVRFALGSGLTVVLSSLVIQDFVRLQNPTEAGAGGPASSCGKVGTWVGCLNRVRTVTVGQKLE